MNTISTSGFELEVYTLSTSWFELDVNTISTNEFKLEVYTISESWLLPYFIAKNSLWYLKECSNWKCTLYPYLGSNWKWTWFELEVFYILVQAGCVHYIHILVNSLVYSKIQLVVLKRLFELEVYTYIHILIRTENELGLNWKCSLYPHLSSSWKCTLYEGLDGGSGIHYSQKYLAYYSSH